MRIGSRKAFLFLLIENDNNLECFQLCSNLPLLSSHSRYHGSWEYKVPWLYGEEAVDVSRAFTKLKLSLMPYFQAQSVYTSRTGVPMLRSIILDFPNNEAVFDLDRQYMLGDNLLVAPVFNDHGDVSFYVPEAGGIWTDFLTGKTYETGWHQENIDYMHLPLLAKPQSIILQSGHDDQAEYDYTDDLTIHVFEPGASQQALIFDTKGEPAGRVEVTVDEDGRSILLEGVREATLALHEDGQISRMEVSEGLNRF